MAYSALNGLNKILRRIGEVQGDAGTVTSFTDSARQRAIDVSLQVINEIIDHIYSLGALQGEIREGTITLVNGTREYAVAADFLGVAGETFLTRVLVNSANNRRLYEYPGGYEKMYADQPDPSDYQGDPTSWALNTANNTFRLDRTPQAAQAGDAYTYLYERHLSIVTETDSFPFPDTAFDQLVPVISEAVRTGLNEGAVAPNYASTAFLGALKTIRQSKRRKRYGWRSAHNSAVATV